MTRFKPGDRVGYYDPRQRGWQYGSVKDFTVSGEYALIQHDDPRFVSDIVRLGDLFSEPFATACEHGGFLYKSYVLVAVMLREGDAVESVKDSVGVEFMQFNPEWALGPVGATALGELHADAVSYWAEEDLEGRHLAFYYHRYQEARYRDVTITMEKGSLDACYAKALLVGSPPCFASDITTSIVHAEEEPSPWQRQQDYQKQIEEFVSIFGAPTFIDASKSINGHLPFEYSTDLRSFRIGRALYAISEDGPTRDFVLSPKFKELITSVMTVPGVCVRCESIIEYGPNARIMPTSPAVIVFRHGQRHDSGDVHSCASCADNLFRGLWLCEACHDRQFPEKETS